NTNRLESKARTEAKKTLHSYAHFKHLNKEVRDELLSDFSRVIKNRLSEKPMKVSPLPMPVLVTKNALHQERIVKRIHAIVNELQNLIGTLQPTSPTPEILTGKAIFPPMENQMSNISAEKTRTRRKIAA
ncbi:MAG: hypothetical protein U0T73_14195, partial [Chitinophagales bacterium]